MELINSHFAHSFVVSSSDIDGTRVGLIFTSNEDEVPLFKLMGSYLLWQLSVTEIGLNLISLLMEIKIHTLAIVGIFGRDWDNNTLSWG